MLHKNTLRIRHYYLYLLMTYEVFMNENRFVLQTFGIETNSEGIL